MGSKRPSRPSEVHPEWTEAAYFNWIRGGLRQLSIRYPIKWSVLEAARRPVEGKGPQRWEYLCAGCLTWHPKKSITVDHVDPCGPLNTYEDLPAFVSKLFCAAEGLQALCDGCHDAKTKSEREAKKQRPTN